MPNRGSAWSTSDSCRAAASRSNRGCVLLLPTTLPMKPTAHFALLALAALTSMAPARAGMLAGVDADADMDPRFRAKIVKEKIKMKALEADNNFAFNHDDHNASSRCGSQSIGNVDTGGKIGQAPREVFVFAPNAINFVDGRGCQ